MTFDKCLKSSSSELPLQVQGSSGQDGLTFGRRISSLQDNFSDVASEDMRRRLPDFEEEVDIEEGLGQPSGDEDLPQEPEQIVLEFDESFQLRCR